MKNTNYRDGKSRVSDLNELEPNDFYSQKREAKVNRFSLIGEDLSDIPTALINNKGEPSGLLLTHDQVITERIFRSVIDHEKERKANANIANDAITNEILQIDLPDDDTYIEDVMKDYDSRNAHVIPDEKLISTNLTKKIPSLQLDETSHPDPLFDTNNAAVPTKPIHQTTRSQLSDFIPTNQVDQNHDLLLDQNVDEKLKSIAAAVEDVALNQEELHMSVQIALEDLKKHEDDDKKAESAILQSLGADLSFSEPTDAIKIELDAKEEEEDHHTSNQFYKLPSSFLSIPADSNLNLNTNFEPDEIIDPITSPTNQTRHPTLKNDFSDFKTDNLEKDDEFYIPTKKEQEINNNTTYQVLEEDESIQVPTQKSQQLNSVKIDHTILDPSMVSWQTTPPADKVNINQEMMDKIRELANQEVQKQMEIEHAKIELERMQMNEELLRTDQEQKDAKLEQLAFIENARKELEKERQLFEEQKQKIADELMSVSKSQHDQLIDEKRRIIAEAQQQKDELIKAAQEEIENEKQRLKEENQRLQASLVETIKENQKYLDLQRQDLLDAAEKEKERLIALAKQDALVEKDNVLTEVKSLLNELRDFKGSNQEKYEQLKTELSEQAKNAIKDVLASANEEKNVIAAEVEKFSSEQKEKFDQLFKELSDVKKQNLVRLPETLETTIVSVEPKNYDAELELKPSDLDRSYTEGPIDSIEIDDLVKEPPGKIYHLKTADVRINNNTAIVPAKATSLTEEFNSDVSTMRSALKKTSHSNDFVVANDALVKQKMKDELKKEILRELSLVLPAIPTNPNPNALYYPTSDLEELETSYHGTYQDQSTNLKQPNQSISRFTDANALQVMNNGVRLQNEQSIPELIKNPVHHLNSEDRPEKLYDLELFEELGMDSYLEGGDLVIESITKDLDKTFDEPKINSDLAQTAPIQKNNNPNSQTNEIATNSSNKTKQKLRNAKLILKEGIDKTTTKDFVKVYAKQLIKAKK